MVLDNGKMEVSMASSDPWWYTHASPYFCPRCKGKMTWGDYLNLGRCSSCEYELFQNFLSDMRMANSYGYVEEP